MNNEQLNEFLAEEVMGWHSGKLPILTDRREYWLDKYGNGIMLVENLHPTTDIAQAIECAEKLLREDGNKRIEITIESNEDGIPYCEVSVVDIGRWMKGEIYPYMGESENITLSLAICHAIYEAVKGGEK